MPALSMQIVSGRYNPLPVVFSRELRQLVKEMLEVDVEKRVTINQILKRPIISKRIKQFLNDNTFKNEFSHTILHNQQVKL